MDLWLIITIVIVAVIVGVALFVAKGRPELQRPGRLPQRNKPGVNGIPVKKAGENINVPGFIPSGSPEDWAGDPVLARLVDLARSDFWILPASQLFKPGDVVTFKARLVQSNGQPVGNVPCVFKRDLGSVALTPPVKSDAAGVALAPYTVQESDMVGDQSDDVPDSGSYRIVCYAGGRRLQKYQHLHDVA